MFVSEVDAKAPYLCHRHRNAINVTVSFEPLLNSLLYKSLMIKPRMTNFYSRSGRIFIQMEPLLTFEDTYLLHEASQQSILTYQK